MDSNDKPACLSRCYIEAGKYSIGIDFGTESARAVMISVHNGQEVATSVFPYPDSVIDEFLPAKKIKLQPNWALQNPRDYLEAIKKLIPEILRKSKVKAENVIGLGIDFTACTMMPIDKEGKALCMHEKYRNRPHAWVKLWKHHGAQKEADLVNETAKKRGEKFLSRYGGKISSEWLFPKILEILKEDPEIYEKADRFIEASDWIVLQLTGQEKRNSCTAGYKAMWDKKEGYPSKEYFKALNPRLENVVNEKLSDRIFQPGTKAGGILKEIAKITGLKEGTPVAVGNVDAHVAVPAATVVAPNKMVIVMGTSNCHMLLAKEKRDVEGICGRVEDGILPGYYGYEAGQSGVGDIFAWFTKNCVNAKYEEEAKRKGIDIHKLLEAKTSKLKVGESGLLALDWWNGNRSILVDVDLSGLLIGCTLNTKPEHIYRTLIESTAFGTYKIIRAFEDSGIKIDEIYACGGLLKNKFLMQIYSDVTDRKIKLADSQHTPALGSAIFGAVAAGAKNGGYDNIKDAVAHMAKTKKEEYIPNPANHKIYEKLFKEYEKLHDYFGRGKNPVMKILRTIRK
jgi:L-ribulokinase